jgi:hypothetical protein
VSRLVKCENPNESISFQRFPSANQCYNTYSTAFSLIFRPQLPPLRTTFTLDCKEHRISTSIAGLVPLIMDMKLFFQLNSMRFVGNERVPDTDLVRLSFPPDWSPTDLLSQLGSTFLPFPRRLHRLDDLVSLSTNTITGGVGDGLARSIRGSSCLSVILLDMFDGQRRLGNIR